MRWRPTWDRTIYRDPRQSLSIRMRAARDAIQFESPKLSATALITDEDSFAAGLDRALSRSLPPMKVIEHRKDEG